MGSAATGSGPRSRSPRTHPERVLGIVALAPGVPHLVPPHPWRAAAHATYDEQRDAPEGWEKENRHVHPRGSSGLLRVLLRRDVPGAALDQADRGRRRLRARRPGRGAGHGRRRAGRVEPRGGRGDLPARALPGARRPRRSRQLPAVRARPRLRRARRRGARPPRRHRPPPQRASAGARQPADPRLRPRAVGPAEAASAHLARAPRPGRGAPCSSRRRSGSVTRGATSRSRASSGASSRASRSTGSRSRR